MEKNKTVIFTLADWEHICATISEEAEKFADMGRDIEFAQQIAGRETSEEDRAVWAQHSTYLFDLYRRIKEQVGLPR